MAVVKKQALHVIHGTFFDCLSSPNIINISDLAAYWVLVFYAAASPPYPFRQSQRFMAVWPVSLSMTSFPYLHFTRHAQAIELFNQIYSRSIVY